MATVVEQANPSRQAVLKVDADGYLLVAGVVSSGASPVPENPNHQVVLKVDADGYLLVAWAV